MQKKADYVLRVCFCIVWMAALVYGASYLAAAMSSNVEDWADAGRSMGCMVVFVVAAGMHAYLIHKKAKES